MAAALDDVDDEGCGDDRRFLAFSLLSLSALLSLSSLALSLLDRRRRLRLCRWSLLLFFSFCCFTLDVVVSADAATGGVLERECVDATAAVAVAADAAAAVADDAAVDVDADVDVDVVVDDDEGGGSCGGGA